MFYWFRLWRGMQSLLNTWYVYMMPIMPLSCVRNVKNVKALWEWIKSSLFVRDKFGFKKSHGKRNFGFDLLASVRFRFLKTETERKFGFCTSLVLLAYQEVLMIMRTCLVWCYKVLKCSGFFAVCFLPCDTVFVLVVLCTESFQLLTIK